jgi:hypothetical protein
MVSGITEPPQPETINFFNKIVEGFYEEDAVDPGKKNIGADTIMRYTIISLNNLEAVH